MSYKHEVIVKYKDNSGLLGLLAVLFIALKLTGVIDWSWFWVLSPLWGPFALAIIGLLLFFFAMYLYGVYLVYKDDQRHKRRLGLTK